MTTTFTAVGPRLDLDGPRPVAPPHSLLNTPGVLVTEDAGRWLNGVNVIAYPEDVPLLWEPCSEDAYRDKDDGAGQTISTFDPFVCYLPITCSSLGVYQNLQDQAKLVLDATYSFGVEEALAQGISGSSNPYFGDANLTLLSAGSPQAALAELEDAIGATGRKGMIHATPAIVSAWMADKLLDPVTLETANGTPVVSGGGYIGTAPVGNGTPSAGTGYAFATGPVEVRLGPVVITDVAETLDRSENILTFRAERYVLALWDTILQVGVNVQWTKSPIVATP